MVAYAHGLVIGKFYPPHAGHHFLIREAAHQSERVTVVAMAAAFESIPLEDRVAWLAEEHASNTNVTVVGVRCELPVSLASDTVWAGQIALMAAAVDTVTDVPVDAVFTSEVYGKRLAAGFDAAHVMVDHARVTVPRSGTAARNDLAGQWDALASATRRGLTTRVVVLGSESTGTTTLSLALAEHYRARGGRWAETQWVSEFGRQYTLDMLAANPGMTIDDVQWESEDFAVIAKTQQKLEDEAAALGSPLLVCDTDALATRVWERRYTAEDNRLAAAAVPVLPKRAVYLLTDHVGVPFEQDGIRDGEHLREEMTGWFVEELTRSGQPWALMTGSLEDRLALAVEMIDRLLTERATFRDPLG